MNDLPPAKNAVMDTFFTKEYTTLFYKKTYLRRLLDYKITIRPYDIYSHLSSKRLNVC